MLLPANSKISKRKFHYEALIQKSGPFKKANVATIKYLAGTCPASPAPMAGLRGTI
jgi:hypothetical protein